jgi:hypothetical protein
MLYHCGFNLHFFVVLEFELWVLSLLGKVLYHLSHAPSPFCLSYFIILLFFFAVLGIEVRDLHLLARHSTT